MRPIGSQPIGWSYCSEYNGIFISSFIAHYSHRLDWQKNYTSLPYRIVQSMFFETFNKNIICFLQDLKFFSSHFPVSYTHLRAHETRHDLVCRLLLEKKKK